MSKYQQDNRGVLDKLIQKITSRKLTVFAIATIAFFLGSLNPDNWVVVAAIYIGSESALDLADIIAKKKQSNAEEAQQ